MAPEKKGHGTVPCYFALDMRLTILMTSIQGLCHVVDLMHGFVPSSENVLFTLESIGTCVKITWNYFPCVVLHKVKVFMDYAQGLVQILLLIFTLIISFLHCLSS